MKTYSDDMIFIGVNILLRYFPIRTDLLLNLHVTLQVIPDNNCLVFYLHSLQHQ